MDRAFARVKRLGLRIEGVTVGTSYGTPALLAPGGKSFCRMKDAETLVLLLPLEEKEMLMEAAPEVYFETDHYKGWPAVLVRLEAIPESELAGRLSEAAARRARSRRRAR
jgi:hypothetical protein